LDELRYGLRSIRVLSSNSSYVFRKLLVLSFKADSNFLPEIPTNVTRIIRAIKRIDEAGVKQEVFYQRGVGTDSTEEDKVVGGMTGDDISEHIREACKYSHWNFIKKQNNWS